MISRSKFLVVWAAELFLALAAAAALPTSAMAQRGGQNWEGYNSPKPNPNQASGSHVEMYRSDDSRFLHNNYRNPHVDDPYSHGAITKNYDIKNPQDRALIGAAKPPVVERGGGQNWEGYNTPDYTNKARPNVSPTTVNADDNRFMQQGGIRDRSAGVRTGYLQGDPVTVRQGPLGKKTKIPTVVGTAHQDSTAAMDRLTGNGF